MNEDEKLSMYIEMGVVEIAGVDENGEFIFNINPSAKFLAPELWESHQDHVDKTLVELYELGMLEITYDENLEATIKLSEEGKAKALEYGIIPVDIDDIPNN